MKKTLLEIVQGILSDMKSFRVNSIADTEEAEMVASIVRQTYENIIAMREDWPHLHRTIQLDAATAARPTHLKLPDYILRLDELRYDRRLTISAKADMQRLTYLEPAEFLTILNARDSTASNITTVQDTGGVNLLIQTDVPPLYWTSFDDKYIVCDAYKASLDSFLQSSKTQALVYKAPVWVHTDTAVPELPAESFPYLIAESKSIAFSDIKEQANQKAEQISNRQRKNMAQHAFAAHEQFSLPDYGRRSKK